MIKSYRVQTNCVFGYFNFIYFKFCVYVCGGGQSVCSHVSAGPVILQKTLASPAGGVKGSWHPLNLGAGKCT